MRRRRDHALDILRRQVRGDEIDGSEMESAARDGLEDPWKLACRSGGFDSTVGSMFGQMQHLRAVGEQRRAAFAEIQSARIHLREVRYDLRSGLSLVRDHSLQMLDQLAIGQGCGGIEKTDVHTLF